LRACRKRSWTLTQCRRHGVSQISLAATREGVLEYSLDDMEARWKTVHFVFTPFHNSGAFELSNVDDVRDVVDDHSTRTQQMMHSPNKDPFIDRLNVWDKTLSLISDVIEAWARLQKLWLYLLPVLDSSEVCAMRPKM
jgi:hypothetical protein